jgi:outer membrane protein assembly factor BamB
VVKFMASVATAAAMFVGLAVAPADAQSFVNWTRYLFSAQHTSHNGAAKSITPANASKVAQAWRFKPPPARSGLAGFWSSPVVYNGVIYIGARNGRFYAIREKTGVVVWSRFIGYVTNKTCGAAGFTSTATVAPDPTTGRPTVYVYGATGYVYAMSAASGANVWPRAKVAIPSTKVNDYYAWSSPLVFQQNIYVGISSQCDAPLVRAGLASFSQATGKRRGTFWTTPPGTRGASIWSSPAGNQSAVYVTTGNGPKGSLGFSIIKLSPSLIKMGSWAVPKSQQVSDSDFGGSVTIWTATINGHATTMAGACNKNGNYYALRASDLAAGPVWHRKIGNSSEKGPGQCDAAAVSDGSHLFLAGNGTNIHGKTYQGSVRKVNPATGAVIWRRGVTGPIIGTPGMDGVGVIAAASYRSAVGKNGVFLINASNGKLLKTIPYGTTSIFGQPVFADNYLLVASTGGRGLTAYKAR